MLGSYLDMEWRDWPGVSSCQLVGMLRRPQVVSAGREDKVEASWREIKRYQDTLAQSQEQLQSAQLMIEESHDRSVATHEKYVSVKRMLRKYEILYRLVTSQLQQRDESYKNYIKSLLSHNVVHTLPSLHRILKKQPVKTIIQFHS